MRRARKPRSFRYLRGGHVSGALAGVAQIFRRFGLAPPLPSSPSAVAIAVPAGGRAAVRRVRLWVGARVAGAAGGGQLLVVG